MAEYIDKQKLMEDLAHFAPECKAALLIAEKQPTAEVEQVRRGQLGISYLDEYFGEFADCKERGTDNILPCNYCRQCGRKIDGGAENA